MNTKLDIEKSNILAKNYNPEMVNTLRHAHQNSTPASANPSPT